MGERQKAIMKEIKADMKMERKRGGNVWKEIDEGRPPESGKEKRRGAGWTMCWRMHQRVRWREKGKVGG